MRHLRSLFATALLCLAPSVADADVFQAEYRLQDTFSPGSFTLGSGSSTQVDGSMRVRMQGPGGYQYPTGIYALWATRLTVQSFRVTLTGDFDTTLLLTGVPFVVTHITGSAVKAPGYPAQPWGVFGDVPLDALLGTIGGNPLTATHFAIHLQQNFVYFGNYVYGNTGSGQPFALRFHGGEVATQYIVPEPATGWLVGIALVSGVVVARRFGGRG